MNVFFEVEEDEEEKEEAVLNKKVGETENYIPPHLPRGQQSVYRSKSPILNTDLHKRHTHLKK